MVFGFGCGCGCGLSLRFRFDLGQKMGGLGYMHFGSSKGNNWCLCGRKGHTGVSRGYRRIR